MTEQQGAHEVLDLDAAIAERSLDPVPVRLQGKTYMVRRDLTGAEAAEFYKLSNAGDDVGALKLLVPSAAANLNKVLEKLPRQHMILVVQKLVEAAELVAKGGGEGESKAS